MKNFILKSLLITTVAGIIYSNYQPVNLLKNINKVNELKQICDLNSFGQVITVDQNNNWYATSINQSKNNMLFSGNKNSGEKLANFTAKEIPGVIYDLTITNNSNMVFVAEDSLSPVSYQSSFYYYQDKKLKTIKDNVLTKTYIINSFFYQDTVYFAALNTGNKSATLAKVDLTKTDLVMTKIATINL